MGLTESARGAQWELQLELQLQAGAEPELPLFLQVARAIAEAIRRGRLRPGAALPGARTLAQQLAVNRNTITAAYDELAAEGWIDRQRARGSYVSRALPEVRPRSFAARGAAPRPSVPARAGFDLGPGPPPARTDLAGAGYGPDVLLMGGGLPDLSLAPIAELARAYRRALQRHARELLAYGLPHGHPRLRAALAEMLARTRGLGTGQDDVLCTRGSQMALDLLARALVTPGDVVAIEAYGYRPAWQALAQAGARLLPIPVDAHGLQVEALQKVLERQPVRALYVTPHHQYPTTVTLSAGRRLALLELARQHRLAIIEDDYDHEFHYEGRPVLPLASTDQAGVVIYVGTLSKILAPGLRIGYVVAPGPLLERLATLRFHVDRQGDQAVELAVAELLEDGEVQRHARRVRRHYQARRDLLADLLSRHLGGALDFTVPSGGMALWARAARDVDVEMWSARALERGVLVHPGRRFMYGDTPSPHLRLGFAALDERKLTLAVSRLREALPAPAPRGRQRAAGRKTARSTQ
jgi:GntR family transcriptional regulator/MocR family aminotransferase